MAPPPELDLTEGNLPQKFNTWKKRLDIYMMATGLSEKGKETRVAIILHCGGSQVQDIFEHFVFDAEADKKDPEKVMNKIKDYCMPRENEVYMAYCFWSAPVIEPFDSFLTDIRSKAEMCNFDTLKERMIRDKIVFSTQGKPKELLLQREGLTLKKAIDICRAYEATKKHTEEMSGAKKISRISKNGTSRYKKKGGKKQHVAEHEDTTDRGSKSLCNYCGYKHEKRKCPAWGQTCDHCKKKNHFKARCKSIKQIHREDTGTEEGSDPSAWLNAVTSSRKPRETALMFVNGCEVRFQLDSGAEVNTICQKYVKKEQVKPTDTKLTMWNSTKLAPLGKVKLKVTNPKNKEVQEV